MSITQTITAWALECQDAEYRLRHSAAMAEIKAALEMLSNFDLAACAGGCIPAEVRALPQYDRLTRGLGLAEHRTSALAAEMLEERYAGLDEWSQSAFAACDLEVWEVAA